MLPLSVFIFLLNLNYQKPEKDEWGTGKEAMEAALSLEKTVNEALFELHEIAVANKDNEVRGLGVSLVDGE